MSASGIQLKKYHQGIWYKRDSEGGEAFSEVAVSLFYDYLSPHVPHVQYRFHPQSKSICICKDFTSGGEFLSLEQFLLDSGCHPDSLFDEDRFDTVSALLPRLGINPYTSQMYWSLIHQLDILFSNPDRHNNNLGFIVSGSSVSLAPVFDNGFSFGVSSCTTKSLSPSKYRNSMRDSFYFRRDFRFYTESELSLHPDVFQALGYFLPKRHYLWPWVGEVLLKFFPPEHPGWGCLPKSALTLHSQPEYIQGKRSVPSPSSRSSDISWGSKPIWLPSYIKD